MGKFYHPQNFVAGPDNDTPSMTAKEIDDKVQQIGREGKVLAMIFTSPEGETAVEVFGPPTQKMIEIFEGVLEGLKRAAKAFPVKEH